MNTHLIFALTTLFLSVMADSKRSFNITQSSAKPVRTDPPKKITYLRTTPEERRKLSVFPKNTQKFVATTKAPPLPKKIDNESRRKHSMLLPKMSKQVVVSTVDTTQAPFKATTMYNFKPTRAPKIGRFVNKQRSATTTTSAPFKPRAYKKDLYRRIEKDESLSKETNLPAALPRENAFSEESSQEQIRLNKNQYKNVKDEVASEEQNEDDLSNEEESFSHELEEYEPIESRAIDRSIESGLEPTVKSSNNHRDSEGLKNKPEVTTEKTVTKLSNYLKQGNVIKEENREVRSINEDGTTASLPSEKHVATKQEQSSPAVHREKRNNLRQDAHFYKIDKRSIIEEENIAPTEAGIKFKYTGIESALNGNSNFKNINV